MTKPNEELKRRKCPKCGEGLGFNWKGPLCEACDGDEELKPEAPERPLSGEWRHSNGFVSNGTLRVFRADFDTNPSNEFVSEVLDWVVSRLNSRASSTTVPVEVIKGAALPSSPSVDALEVVRNLAEMYEAEHQEAMYQKDAHAESRAQGSIKALEEVITELEASASSSQAAQPSRSTATSWWHVDERCEGHEDIAGDDCVAVAHLYPHLRSLVSKSLQPPSAPAGEASAPLEHKEHDSGS